MAYAAFVAAEKTRRQDYADWGHRILDWTLNHLMDPADTLMWDNVSLNGKVEKTKWSYNTGLTLRAIFEAEKRGHKFAVPSRQMWDSAWKHWKKGNSIACEGKFAHLLVEAGLACGYLTAEDRRFVVDLLEGLGKPRGWVYGSRWDRPLAEGERAMMIDQAAALRMAALLARS